MKIHYFEKLAYVGPDIKEGMLPAVFYFALSAEESLGVDPYNQPVKIWSEYPLRVFTITLPGHGDDLDSSKAMQIWADKLDQGENIVIEILDQIERAIHHLIEKKIITPEKTALAGLSRGGFIATHIGSRFPNISTILGFAPLTQLSHINEFQEKTNPLAHSLDLYHLAPLLIHHKVRFYIGNHDTRVSTERCFHFINTLTQTAVHNRIRSPQTELFIRPSIGFKGHGTSPEVFEDGARWIINQLGL